MRHLSFVPAVVFAVLGTIGPTGAQTPGTVAPVPVVPRTTVPAPRPDDFFLPLMPRFVAGPVISEANWSPDGRYVAAVVDDYEITGLPSEGSVPSRTHSLVIWNAATHKSAVVWSTGDLRTEIQSVSWFPGSPVAFVSASLPGQDGELELGYWRVDARRVSATRLEGFGKGEAVWVSPTQPYAFAIAVTGRTAVIRPLLANGALGTPVNLPQPAIFPLGWTQDGKGLIFPPLLQAAKGSPSREGQLSWQILDARTGKVSMSESRPVLYRPVERVYPFRLALEKAKTPSAPPVELPWSQAEVAALWLEQGTAPKPDRLLLSPSAQKFQVSPKGDAVLYINHEGAFVVSLLRVPRKAMEEARETAQRIQLMNNGKQIAVAIIMRAVDHEDTLPLADGLRDSLAPYVRSDEITKALNGEPNSFVYLLNGGAMTAIEDPANTMMGYIPGPGGYAVVYADGHVQWKPQLPTTPPSG